MGSVTSRSRSQHRKRVLSLIAFALLAACARTRAPAVEARPSAREQNKQAAPAPAAQAQPRDAVEAGEPEPAHAPRVPIVHELRAFAGRSEGLYRFRIPLAQAQFSFVNLAYERPLVAALAGHDLVFNGGYWAYAENKRVIQGLLIINDTSHAAKAGTSGGVLEVRSGMARMVRTADYEASPGTALAVQCSPRLVSAGKLVAKLDALRHAARTALCVGQDAGTLAVYLTAQGVEPTLAELAGFLRAEGCRDALNLDGGPSTAAVARSTSESFKLGRGESLPYGIGVSLLR
jgi:hypothetical protein